MRGKLELCPASSPPLRNIPAYAGKTIAAMIGGIVGAEHPRVCGENASGLLSI